MNFFIWWQCTCADFHRVEWKTPLWINLSRMAVGHFAAKSPVADCYCSMTGEWSEWSRLITQGANMMARVIVLGVIINRQEKVEYEEPGQLNMWALETFVHSNEQVVDLHVGTKIVCVCVCTSACGRVCVRNASQEPEHAFIVTCILLSKLVFTSWYVLLLQLSSALSLDS